MSEKQAILVCGDVQGKFKFLFRKAEFLAEKAGAFDMLLCVGDFFGSDVKSFEAYKNGKLKVNIPTYILGPTKKEHAPFYENLNEGEICSNVTYLGRRGLYTLSSGLKIAYVSGTEAPDTETTTIWNFNSEDVKTVANACLCSNAATGEFRGIDILITSQWPSGVRQNEPNTSKLLSWLSSEIKPRYHFCGLNDDSFEPPLFRNAARPNSQFELATRFIALANLKNEQKKKFLYALTLTPVDKMRLTDLIEKTTNEIPCPYDTMQLPIQNKIANNSSDNQYFYNFDQSNDHNQRKRGRFDGGQKSKQPRFQNIDQEKCWFCLSSPSVEKHLVISIGDSFYLALAKGPLNQYHVLILCVTHIRSVSLLAENDWKELEKFKTALRKFFATKGEVVVFFERNYKSDHLHINVCPIDKSKQWKIKHAFEDKSEEYNLTLETLPKLEEPTQLPDRGAYFVAELPDESVILCRQMKQFPINFGREVIIAANEDSEDKINWRDCLLSKEIEIDYVKQFRNEFKPFDFTV